MTEDQILSWLWSQRVTESLTGDLMDLLHAHDDDRVWRFSVTLSREGLASTIVGPVE